MKNVNLNPVVFTTPGTRLSGDFITITPRGGFLFSSGLVHKENITRHKCCILSYDKRARVILLNFNSDSGREGSIKITHRKENNSSIMSGSFFSFFKLNPQELTGRYKAETVKLDSDPYLAIYLDKKMPKRGLK